MISASNIPTLALGTFTIVTQNYGNTSITETVEDRNSSRWINTTTAPATPPGAHSYVVLFVLIVLILFTCAANIVVILCCRVEKSLRTTSSLYIVSLAIVDANVGATVMLGMLIYTFYGYWPLGFTLCTIWMSVDFTSCTVSMLHLILVAHDRYVALVHPLDYKTSRTSKDALKRLSVAWVVGILGWAPAIIVYKMTSATTETGCFYLPSKLYVLIQSCAAYFIPIIIMLYFYARCLRVLRLRYLKTAANNSEGAGTQPYVISSAEFSVSTTNNASAAVSNTTSGNSANEAQHAVMKAKLSKQQQQLRSVRTLGVVIAGFLLCWLPFCFMWPITIWQPGSIPLRLYEVAYWYTYINSTINPCLYFLSNKDFRDAFKKLVKCRYSK